MYHITLKILDMHILMCGFIHIPTGMIIPREILTFALRAVLMTAVRTSLIRMVMSAATTAFTVSRIPTGGALRTFTVTSTVRVKCTRVVTSTTAVGLSAIPTETTTPSTLLHVLGVIYVKREEMTL